MNVQQLYNKTAANMAWDFDNNPFQISYINEKKIHTEVGSRSDISVHLPLLSFLASQVDYIVELGVREGESTLAFLAANPASLISVDINKTPLLDKLDKMPNWKFIQSSSTNPNLDIGLPQLLFIDSDHSYEHVTEELRLHAKKVFKWLAFHDSWSCVGVQSAIENFLLNNEQWHKVYTTTINHGLTILQRG